MKINQLILLMTILLGIYIFSSSLLDLNNRQPNSQYSQSDNSTAPAQEDNNFQHYALDYFGISMEVPKNLNVQETPNFNELTNDIASATLYIQDYGAADQPATGNFQIYGLVQYDIPTTTWEELSKITSDKTTYSYVKEIQLGDLKGYEAQYAGQRNRYVYMMLLNNHVVTFAVSEPTLENKLLAEKILSTIKLPIVGELPRSNDRCDQYSGFHSYAWGGGSEKCEAQGCKVVKTRVIDDPRKYDDEGFEFKCVTK